MGYGLMGYSVDINHLKTCAGSKDEALYLKIKTEMKANDYEFGEEDEEPSIEEALRQILIGEDLDPDYGHVYTHAFEELCKFFGEFLQNDQLYPIQPALLDDLIQALDALTGKADSFTYNLFYRYAPIELPHPDDFPNVGYLTRDEVSRAWAILKDKDLSTIRAGGMKEDLIPSFTQLLAWLSQAHKDQKGIVTFYY